MAHARADLPRRSERHPFGDHGMLLALPLSAVLWIMLLLPFWL